MPLVYQLYPLISRSVNASAVIVPRPLEYSKCSAGDTFLLEGEQLKFSQTGEIHVPAKIMKEYGYQRKDGRYALAILPMLQKVDGRLTRGAVIPYIPGIDDTLETVDFGDIIYWENGDITVEHPQEAPKSLWFGEDYRFEIEKMEKSGGEQK